MPKVQVSNAAKADLRDIRRYSKAIFGARVAFAYLDGLRGTFGLLRERPYVGAPEHDLGTGMRKIGYRSHIVYYVATAQGVEIVRILHHARDAFREMRRP